MAKADLVNINILGINHQIINNDLFLPDDWFSLKEHKWLKNNYEPTDNEIWIASYPKTGITLTLQICHEIMGCYYNKTKSKNDEYYKETDKQYSSLEWFTVMRTQGIDQFDKHIEKTKNTKRIWKTHCKLKDLPCCKLPKKMIIICRNPKDALVSFYYHTINGTKAGSYNFSGSFDTYYTMWVTGLVENSSYFDWYKSYWNFYTENLIKKKKKTQIYWLNYENLVINGDS
eukprot:541273_1